MATSPVEIALLSLLGGTLVAQTTWLRSGLSDVRAEMRHGFAAVDGRIDSLGERTARLEEAVGGLRGEMGELRGEMGELRGEMAELRGEVRGSIGELRGEVNALAERVRSTYS